MSAIKKLQASGKSQDFASSDVRSGNNGYGSGTSKGTQYISWPYDASTYSEAMSPTKMPMRQRTVAPQDNSVKINTGIN